jgi:hypothetical protein
MLLYLAPTIALEDLIDAIECGHVLESHKYRTNILCAYDTSRYADSYTGA